MSINLRDDEGDCGGMRKDSCAPADDCAAVSPYNSDEDPVTDGSTVTEREDEDGSSRNISLGLREVGEIRCADARPV